LLFHNILRLLLDAPSIQEATLGLRSNDAPLSDAERQLKWVELGEVLARTGTKKVTFVLSLAARLDSTTDFLRFQDWALNL